MRLTAQARIYLPGEELFRKPSFWDNFKGAFGADVDLRTGELQITSDVLATTEQVQQGLQLAKVTNAVSLVVDNDVIYQDLEDRADDAQLLVQAMRRSAGRFNAGFKTLRAVFEHSEAGLHMLIEVTVFAKAKKGTPAAMIAVGARIDALRPKDNEDIEAAKDRIGKALGDAQLVPTYRTMLSNFMMRLQSGMQRVFIRGEVEVDNAEVQVVRPSGQDVRDLGAERNERAAQLRAAPSYQTHYGMYYDPWSTYYRDPMDTFVNLMVLDALISPRHSWGYAPGYLGSSWGNYGAPVQIINYNGNMIGDAAHIDQFQHQLGDVGQVADMDFGSANWDDRALANYDASSSSWAQNDSGTDSASGGFDCAADSGGYGGGADTGGGNSYDCAAADCAASDCAWDCSSDCSSDCSWDCGGGGD